ncbi:protein phosphatase 1 regulatory subunit 1C isoform X3 [Amia ocellicauda]|uniref:protein phosphatase 1 regulatory subunit 1C isoform X3 n=1 Tax=Amia ocellicauda TaxID=2972642 RepID=UPI00346490C9
MEPNSPKKIQFAVPLFQSQLDPQAAEHIRRRRPTPATLVIFNDQSPPEVDEKRTTSNPGEAQSAEMSPKQRKQSVFTPPTMKGTVQAMNRQIPLKVVMTRTILTAAETYSHTLRRAQKSSLRNQGGKTRRITTSHLLYQG